MRKRKQKLGDDKAILDTEAVVEDCSTETASSLRESSRECLDTSTSTNLKLPVGRVDKLLKKQKCAVNIGADAPQYLCSILEYLNGEIQHLTEEAKAKDGKAFVPRHITLKTRSDEDLRELIGRSCVHHLSVQLPVIGLTNTEPVQHGDDDDADRSCNSCEERKPSVDGLSADAHEPNRDGTSSSSTDTADDHDVKFK